jgi:hypothetical protein
MKLSFFQLGLVALVAGGLSGCAWVGFHSPAIDVLGSYFPAWMVCIIAGLVLTVISRLLLAAFKLDSHVRPSAIVYPCLMLVFTMSIWLLFFQN